MLGQSGHRHDGGIPIGFRIDRGTQPLEPLRQLGAVTLFGSLEQQSRGELRRALAVFRIADGASVDKHDDRGDGKLAHGSYDELDTVGQPPTKESRELILAWGSRERTCAPQRGRRAHSATAAAPTTASSPD